MAFRLDLKEVSKGKEMREKEWMDESINNDSMIHSIQFIYLH